MPYGTRAPKELLHHLPALVLRRPSVSAHPTGMLPGVRGSRMRDRRPPHYRCPAVPGLTMSARAILMALGSSVLPSGINHSPTAGTALLRTAGDANRSVTYHSATVRQPAPSPVLHLLRLGTPLPNLPVRAPAADAFTGVLLMTSLLGTAHCTYRYCSRRPLITAGHPVRRQSRRRPATALASELHHRTVLHTATSCTADTADRQFVSARPSGPSGLREKP